MAKARWRAVPPGCAPRATHPSALNKHTNTQCEHPFSSPPHPKPCPPACQTYLEQNEGPGLQHLALKTNDIIATLRQMRAVGERGGFEFMRRPCDAYYRNLPKKIVSRRGARGCACFMCLCVGGRGVVSRGRGRGCGASGMQGVCCRANAFHTLHAHTWPRRATC